jgi:hypothetical protein
MKRIKSIEKGSGESSTYFAVNDKYRYAPFGDRIHEIKEEEKIIGKGYHNDITITVYNGYDVSGRLLFTIEAMSNLTISYDVA